MPLAKEHEIQCINCGKSYVTIRETAKFCSPKCARKFYYDTNCATIIKRNTQNIQAKMKLNPEFRKKHLETIHRCGKNSERRYKEKIFSLLGNKCEVCGISIPEVLTIHHNNPKTKPRNICSSHKWRSMYLQYFEGQELRLLCFNDHALLHRNKLQGKLPVMLTSNKIIPKYKGKLSDGY